MAALIWGWAGESYEQLGLAEPTEIRQQLQGGAMTSARPSTMR